MISCQTSICAFSSCSCSASKRAIVQAPPIATSGGRTQGLRREVTGMDARQAPIRPWMARRRVLPEQARSEGTPKRSVGAG
ncbi:hypothetical protein C1X75_10290 [Pseudomonas sp. FW305-17]|nr:hypothetical protein C1X79_09940 [Pseudomonas sp. FW305-42]PNA22523.1 hypothetical protein C1X78_16180 [Pseudomonas sp. MPR-R1B]PNB26079.1 hypothetical protein C1X80_11625 [Pseudomonas sp. DP16D-E2]PNB43638.1 hypothetical protein C1X75_10290 [Pseudomonas sp. FW305-17]PNB61211.1 hypothetical protein C1X77_12005 [Pseudomonas sp. GW531-E2]PNB69511.1 hypothetical protein C1X76_03035 [Pseudomonas sp. FW305-127]